MPRKIDVELTSARDDGTFTWRAAGAREPKGVVDASVLYSGAKVGDVLRAEVEIDVDGITITSVQPPKGKSGPPSGLIEIVGTPRDFEGVTTSFVPKAERPRGDRRDRGDRGDRGGPRDRPPRPAGERTSQPGGRPPGDRERGPARGPRPDGERRDRGARPPRPDRPDRPHGDRRPSPPGAAPRDSDAGRRGPKRLNPASTYRNAVVESLSPEQRAVAEQLLRGGIPSVRRAIDEQNTAARAEGHPEIKPEPLLAMAEELLPRVKAAEWRDRAEAVSADIDTVGLRDLRSVVSGADANARDEESRLLAGALREALERRLKEEREEWTGAIVTAIEENRLVRALRVATRAPDPSMRLPSDLAMRLAAAASEQLSSDTTPDRWSALLEAVVASPVRTTVKPTGLPPEPGEALLQAARQAAGRIPHLAQLLGIKLPPPPMAARGARKGPPPRPPRPPRPPQAPQAAAHAEPAVSAEQAAPAQPAAPAEPPAPAPAAEPVAPAEAELPEPEQSE